MTETAHRRLVVHRIVVRGSLDLLAMYRINQRSSNK